MRNVCGQGKMSVSEKIKENMNTEQNLWVAFSSFIGASNLGTGHYLSPGGGRGRTILGGIT